MFQLILEWFTGWLRTPKHKYERGPTISVSSAAEEPLRKEEQEEIDAGMRGLAQLEPGGCAVRKLGVDAQMVYCGLVQLSAGQLLTEASVRGAVPRELGTITRIRVFTFDSFALRLGLYGSAELVHLRPDVYDCDSIEGAETHKVFQVLTTEGWFPKHQEDTTVQLSTR